MEPECSLLCSQQPATGPYPKPDKSNSPPDTLFFKINFHITLPPKPSLPSGLYPSELSTKITVFRVDM